MHYGYDVYCAHEVYDVCGVYELPAGYDVYDVYVYKLCIDSLSNPQLIYVYVCVCKFDMAPLFLSSSLKTIRKKLRTNRCELSSLILRRAV